MKRLVLILGLGSAVLYFLSAAGTNADNVGGAGGAGTGPGAYCAFPVDPQECGTNVPGCVCNVIMDGGGAFCDPAEYKGTALPTNYVIAAGGGSVQQKTTFCSNRLNCEPYTYLCDIPPGFFLRCSYINITPHGTRTYYALVAGACLPIV